MSATLKAPFPWFGGKSRVALLVWQRFGAVRNYVEPFAGSLTVLLGRPTPPKVETVNDIECYLANFWRALAADPEQVAHYADYPVNEADLHARHRWLVATGRARVEQLRTDPEFFDAKIAGWWVWGQCLWIGSGWCAPKGFRGSNGGTESPSNQIRRPHLSSGQGVVASKLRADRNAGRTGVLTHAGKRPALTGKGNGVGVNRAALDRTIQQIPDLSGDSGAVGRGLHREDAEVLDGFTLWNGRGNGARCSRGIHAESRGGVLDYLLALSERLRRVRVCCGDWKRILGPSPTVHIGTTAVFLDPPYSGKAGRRKEIYAEDCLEVAHACRVWAIEHGDDRRLRIALCGYEGEHDMPASWTCVAWKAVGGYGSQGSGAGRANAERERIWFSPHCLKHGPVGRQEHLFA